MKIFLVGGTGNGIKTIMQRNYEIVSSGGVSTTKDGYP